MANIILNIFFAMWTLGNIVAFPYMLYTIFTGKCWQADYKPSKWIVAILIIGIIGIVGSLITAAFTTANLKI